MKMVTKLVKFINKIKLVIVILKGEICMLDMYVALVMNHRRTCNAENHSVPQVPSNWREYVLADLEALGLDADGNPKTVIQ